MDDKTTKLSQIPEILIHKSLVECFKQKTKIQVSLVICEWQNDYNMRLSKHYFWVFWDLISFI